MTTRFNAMEIYDLSKKVEKNGIAFYEQAQKIAEDPEHKRLFMHLANAERQHLKEFTAFEEAFLQSESTAANMFDTDSDIARYLQMLADTQMFTFNVDINKVISSIHSIMDCIDWALRMEQDSIVLYSGLLEFTLDVLGHDQIHRILTMERGHFVMLSEFRTQFEE